MTTLAFVLLCLAVGLAGGILAAHLWFKYSKRPVYRPEDRNAGLARYQAMKNGR